jgi:accessory colonization factor AcfC
MLGWAFASCKSNVKVEKVTVDSITPTATTPAPAVHGTLSAAQLEKITTIQRIFAEVNPSTLEETIDDFKQEQDPDREIAIWSAMANAYEKFTNRKPLDINKKTEVYNLILMRSMENEADAKAETNLKYLTDKEASELLSYYTLEARPITVEKK